MDGSLPDIARQACVPCVKETQPLRQDALRLRLEQLGHKWEAIEEHHLEKAYRFRNFLEALAFANRVGTVAEDLQHHPDLLVSWGKVVVTIWTHSIGGLSDNDFILAARIELLSQPSYG